MLELFSDIGFALYYIVLFSLFRIKLSGRAPTLPPGWIAHPLQNGKLLRDKEISLKDFERVQILAATRTANVFLAKHKGSNLYYALKGVKKREIYAYDMFTKVQREIEIHLNLGKWTPNLFRVFDHHSYVFFVSEYCVCGDLALLQRRVRWLPHQVIKYYILQVIAALEYLHGARKTIHRNVEAANVLIGKNVLFTTYLNSFSAYRSGKINRFWKCNST